ncbi:MAG: hypothetical protein AB7P22_06665 [Vicinamibacterales bacterium]
MTWQIPVTSLRPDRLTLDRGTERWRPAKVTAVNGATATVRVYIASGFVRSRTVATATLPSQTIGSPLAVQIDSDHPETCAITSLVGSHWPGGEAPASEAAASTDDGRWPCIPRSITGEPLAWWTGTAW